jgi:hypothetical protein
MMVRGARAASGHMAAEPAISLTKSRRRICLTRHRSSQHEFATQAHQNRNFAPSDMGRNGQFALQKF